MVPNVDMRPFFGLSPKDRVINIEKEYLATHKGKYSYKDTVYKNESSTIRIKCNRCESEGRDSYFTQKAGVHKRGYGCKVCSVIDAGNRYRHDPAKVYEECKTNNDNFVFVKKWFLKHYNGNNKNSIPCICKSCFKIVTMIPAHLKNGHGCKDCKNKANGKLKRHTKKDILSLLPKIPNSNDKYKLLSNFTKVYLNKNTPLKWLCPECNKSFICTADAMIYSSYLCPTCYPRFTSTISTGEKSLADYVKSLTYIPLTSDRKLIKPLELDILIPIKKLAIEYNGVYWHSSTNVHKNYHKEKTLAVRNKGYNLFHVWEDQWLNKQSIIKSMIKSKLGLITDKYYARTLEVRVLEKTPKDFYNDSHLQGSVNCKYNLGLYKESSLLAVMSFNKSRDNKNIELVRFSTVLNKQVVGGFSKLLANAIKLFKFKGTIISFSDDDYSDGGVYRHNGFKVVNRLAPDYFYVDTYTYKRYHKSKFRKSRLKIYFGADYDPNKTELEMVETIPNIVRCYNSGKIKWRYTIEKESICL